MNKRVLVLTGGDIYERRGLFNAVINRTKHLKNICDYDVDTLIICSYEPWLVRKLRHKQKQATPSNITIDGIECRIKWLRFSILDYILQVRFHKKPLFKDYFYNNFHKVLKGYDLIVAHSTECGIIAMNAKKSFGIPYTVTWHGSDIHTAPFSNSSVMSLTRSIMNSADMNIFVSKALRATSSRIIQNVSDVVLYNGCDERFMEYSPERKLDLKKKLNVEEKKVVVFAGGFVAVKNILVIPKIFNVILSNFKNVEFWIIGSGKFRSQVEEMSIGLPVRFWGNQAPEVIPDYFNASDVLILPSINEGLPLTIVEGLKCGCNVVGSMVGGIPEVIGKENCFDPADNDFVEKFAHRVIYFLKAEKHVKQPLNSCFDWSITAEKELNIIKDILK